MTHKQNPDGNYANPAIGSCECVDLLDFGPTTSDMGRCNYKALLVVVDKVQQIDERNFKNDMATLL